MKERATPFHVLVAASLVAAACGGAPRDGAEPAGREVSPRNDDGPAIGVEAAAPDGLPLVYDARGRGETALVFVHCWSCDRAFWREQVDAFAEDYRVVALDLGGHGESGAGRQAWSIRGFGADVKAVADALGLKRMVLVGHSMGGPVSLEAARLMPGRVLGVIAADTLQDADFKFPEEAFHRLLAGLEADFAGAMTGMMQGMMVEGGDPALRDWITAKALAARPEVALALLRDFAALDMPAMFAAAGVPIRAINAAPAPGSGVATNVEGNRKYADYDAAIVDGVGHFLQLEKPEEFNRHLRRFVDELARD